MNDHLEVLMRLIDKEDRYHQVKENMAWVAVPFYAGFAGAVSIWYWKNPQQPPLTTAFGVGLIIIYLCVLVYVQLQFRSRWDSVNRTNRYTRQLRSMVPQLFETKQYAPEQERNPIAILFFTILFPFLAVFLLFPWAAFYFYEKEKNPESTTPRDALSTRYLTEIPVYTILLVLLIAQIIVLILKCDS